MGDRRRPEGLGAHVQPRPPLRTRPTTRPEASRCSPSRRRPRLPDRTSGAVAWGEIPSSRYRRLPFRPIMTHGHGGPAARARGSRGRRRGRIDGLLVVSGFTYVKNSGEGAYFKVPDDWKLYKLDPNAFLTIGRSPTALTQRISRRAVAESCSTAMRSPTSPTSRTTSPRPIVGQAEISPIGQSVRDQVSNVDLRALALDGTGDPIAMYQQGSTDIEIVKYEALTTQRGPARQPDRPQQAGQRQLRDDRSDRAWSIRAPLPCTGSSSSAHRSAICSIGARSTLLSTRGRSGRRADMSIAWPDPSPPPLRLPRRSTCRCPRSR